MLRVRPFHAIRPRPELAPQVAAVPYDVVNTEEARALADNNPISFLHISRAEIDLPADTHPYDPIVYQQARAALDRFLSEGTFLREEQAKLYLYRQIMDGRAQIGIVGCCHVQDYYDDIIKKHEKTRKDKEDDRTRHVVALNANSGPVFLTYRDVPAIDQAVAKDTAQAPLYDFTAPDGVQHTVWIAQDAELYRKAFAQVPTAYVADGHHRSASAARAGADRKAANPAHTGEEEYNYFLAVLFPASQLAILPYNRVIRDLNGLSSAEVREKLAALGSLEPCTKPSPERCGQCCVYLDKAWYRLDFDPKTIDHTDPIGSLDVSLLQERVLAPLFGIFDPRTDKRVDFVGGIRGTKELERRVDSGEMAIAFSMYPTTIEQLLAVSDAGLIMPPKSTWFEPKLRSGLLVHSLD
ncbi:MAG: DUF1015 family protein [Myxococcota bacterium]|jgi:uncharacterized protein (DUF1015 family)|nr:DUF1015 family protein [Myxococcota bacterium]